MTSPNRTKRKSKNIRVIEALMLKGIDDTDTLRTILKTDHGSDVTDRTVRNYKVFIHNHWKELNLEGAKTLGDRMERHYWRLYAEAVEAWEASKEARETELSETTQDGHGADKTSKAQIRTEAQTGNPAHWKNAETALAAIRKMRGLDEPERFSWETNLPPGYTAEEVEDQFVRLLIEAEKRKEEAEHGEL